MPEDIIKCTIEDIKNLIPHRYPILLVDRAEINQKEESVVGYKAVTYGESVFQGHFPGYPVFPGVLMIEAMAQCSALLESSFMEAADRKRFISLFGGIDKARFRASVEPGSLIELYLKRLRRRGGFVWHEGCVKSGGEVCVEATLMAYIKLR